MLAPIPLRCAGIPGVDTVRGGAGDCIGGCGTARCCDDDCVGGIGVEGNPPDDAVRVIVAGGGGVRDDRGPWSDGFGGGTEPRDAGGFEPAGRAGGVVGTSFVRPDGGALRVTGAAGGGRVTAFIEAVETLAGGGGGARTPLAEFAAGTSPEPFSEGARPSSWFWLTPVELLSRACVSTMPQ